MAGDVTLWQGTFPTSAKPWLQFPALLQKPDTVLIAR